MADDGGMLLNFDLSTDVVSNFSKAPAISGGRWKERFKAKKQAQYKQKRANAELNPKPVESNTDETRGHANVQMELNEIAKEWSNATPSLKRKRDDLAPKSNASTNTAKTGPPQQVISSLFSSNPTATTQPLKASEQEVVDSTPSNAPLTDGSAFGTLGLSPTLSSHLIAKLNLKTPTSIQQTAVPQLIASDSDAFIQAETGSGKTLTYLLPVVQRIISASTGTAKLHRDSGCFAIILAPTRELGRQIYSVLTQLVSHPSLHWIVPILLLGGEKKKSEKARLRKGGNIIVATPGRLADHLENTKSLDVSNIRWVILDEGDRLMELGFEETLQKILETLAQKSRVGRGFTPATDFSGIPKRMITMLCSATIKGNVQRLGDISLKDALFIKAETKGGADQDDSVPDDDFKAPAQLRQSYIVAPAKLRLVSLAAALKRAFIRRKEGVKVVVFFSCADSVDFHFKVFRRSDEENDVHGEEAERKTNPKLAIKPKRAEKELADETDDVKPEKDADDASPGNAAPKKKPFHNPAVAKAPLLDPAITLFKLHGSLTQPIRTATINAFANNKEASVLFCTDVASRGLDLPNVDLVIQFDPPFSKEDYLHRIGRTARAGREGRAMIFLLPGCEESYPSEILKGAVLGRTDSTEVLKKGFEAVKPAITIKGNNGKIEGDLVIKKSAAAATSQKHDFLPYYSGSSWEEAATEYHLDIERWVLSSPKNLEAARRAFQSHIRAYATHVASERHVFDIKSLHLGHLAKAFGLRDKPSSIKVPGRGQTGADDSNSAAGADKAKNARGGARGGKDGKRTGSGVVEMDVDSDAEERVKKRKVVSQNAEMQGTEESKKMRMKMREHMSAISEFNIG